jgi:SOS-response transcriptional repressor LexA
VNRKQMIFRRQREAALLAWLVECAEAGRPCPTNRETSERLGLSSVNHATVLYQALEEQGLIRVECSRTARVVTIVASGGRTAGLLRTIAHYEKAESKEHRLSAAQIAARRVDRSACPRCAVRSDVGCAHQAQARGLTSWAA